MRRWMTVGAAVAGGIAAGAIAAVSIGSARWNRATARAIDRLSPGTTGAERASPETFSLDRLDSLPAPVRRYFTFALTPGQPLVRRARVRWAGEFRSSATSAWSTFTAEQYFSVRPPGFVWDASIRMAPLVTVRVRDGYVAGEGTMLGKIASLVPVVDQHGTPEMAAGALSRFLGEAVWLPTALLPGAGISWTPIDDRSARATLADGATTVSADFRFGPRGEITGAAMMRYRDVNGRGVLTPFEAQIGGDYRRVAGMMIPSAGEAGWVLPEGRLTYWRGRVVEAVYQTAP